MTLSTTLMVTSASKLIHGIIGQENVVGDENQHQSRSVQDQIDAMMTNDAEKRTVDIRSDPLLHFAAVFAALIHYIDHNQQSEDTPPISFQYPHPSIATPSAVNTTWEMLMQDKYRDLRKCIFVNDTDMKRFRKWLTLAVVMAPNLVHPSLRLSSDSHCIQRHAFNETGETCNDSNDVCKDDNDSCEDDEARLVLEIVVQTSYTAHAMHP